MINSKPVITKAWTTNFNFNAEILKTIPLWVRLPDLPLNCWENESLRKIGSSLGNPIYEDDCTTKIYCISYARILVKMDITLPLPTKVKLKDPNGRQFEQVVDYDRKLVYFTKCLQLGHSCQTRATHQPQQIWYNKQTYEWKVK